MNWIQLICVDAVNLLPAKCVCFFCGRSDRRVNAFWCFHHASAKLLRTTKQTLTTSSSSGSRIQCTFCWLGQCLAGQVPWSTLVSQTWTMAWFSFVSSQIKYITSLWSARTKCHVLLLFWFFFFKETGAHISVEATWFAAGFYTGSVVQGSVT